MNLQIVHEILGSVWTVWAVLVFVGILYWALRPTNRQRFEKDAQIPFNDEA